MVEIYEKQYLNLIGITGDSGKKAYSQWENAKNELLDRSKFMNTAGGVRQHRLEKSRRKAMKKAQGNASPKFEHAAAWIKEQIEKSDKHTDAGEIFRT